MGEHLPCKQGVRSSNLLISTKGTKRIETETALIYGLIAQAVRARA